MVQSLFPFLGFIGTIMMRSTTIHGRKRTSLATSLMVLCYCRSLSSQAAIALNTVVITGTTRTSGPPRPILGPRVAKFVTNVLEQRGHTVTAVLDPMKLELPLLQKPHFAYAPSQVPSHLQEMATLIKDADCYVTITPEYNHAPSPALLNILNHYGSSIFGFKPSAIVSYSAGQWGGTRAAHALRPILSELGCLPVSAMVHIPLAQEVFDDDGNIIGDEMVQQKWNGYVERCFSQLEWWGQAAKNHKQQVDPLVVSPAFVTSPTERNAPSS